MPVDIVPSPALQAMQALYAAMPPVAALPLRLQQSGLAAEVYVADTQLHYRAPLFADLQATARLAEPDAWAGVLERLRDRGRASVRIAACVTLPDGGIAAECEARFVAVASGYDRA